jgi:hypothetical protein
MDFLPSLDRRSGSTRRPMRGANGGAASAPQLRHLLPLDVPSAASQRPLSRVEAIEAMHAKRSSTIALVDAAAGVRQQQATSTIQRR